MSEERFTAFCLPGMLPGPYMGYNQHGMVFSVNTITTGRDGWDRMRKNLSKPIYRQMEMLGIFSRGKENTFPASNFSPLGNVKNE